RSEGSQSDAPAAAMPPLLFVLNQHSGQDSADVNSFHRLLCVAQYDSESSGRQENELAPLFTAAPDCGSTTEQHSRGLCALIRLPGPVDVELHHAEHGLHRTLRAGPIRAAQIFGERRRHDLPRHAKTIAEPAAPLRLPAIGGQRAPEAIDLRLIGAVDL